MLFFGLVILLDFVSIADGSHEDFNFARILEGDFGISGSGEEADVDLVGEHGRGRRGIGGASRDLEFVIRLDFVKHRLHVLGKRGKLGRVVRGNELDVDDVVFRFTPTRSKGSRTNG